MNNIIISNYINKITKEDIKKYALKQNITLTEHELDIIYYHIKNNYLIFLKDPFTILNQIKKEVRTEVYNHIITLYNKYQNTIKKL